MTSNEELMFIEDGGLPVNLAGVIAEKDAEIARLKAKLKSKDDEIEKLCLDLGIKKGLFR